MKKQPKVKALKVEGVSLNAAWVAGMSREQWVKAAQDTFPLIGGKTPTAEQRAELLDKVYEQAHKEVGTTPQAARTVKAESPSAK